MSPIIPSRYGHPKYNIFPQKSRATSLGGFKATQRGISSGGDSKSNRRKQRVEESKITVQPTEDEEQDNFFSKHLAAARFQRNHRLINILFSDVVVDQELPLDTDKLTACKKRVKSLTDYQKKIDDEIVELNDRFNVKKAKISEEGKKFAHKLADFIVNSKKELETLRAAQEIRRQQEVTLKLQQQQREAENSLKNKLDSINGKETISPNNNKDEGGLAPMDVSAEGRTMSSNQNLEVKQVLDQILSSIANSI